MASDVEKAGKQVSEEASKIGGQITDITSKTADDVWKTAAKAAEVIKEPFTTAGQQAWDTAVKASEDVKANTALLFGAAPGLGGGKSGGGMGGAGGGAGQTIEPKYYMGPEAKEAFERTKALAPLSVPTKLPAELSTELTRGLSDLLNTQLTETEGKFQVAGMGGRGVSTPRSQALTEAAENIAERAPALYMQQLEPLQRTALETYKTGTLEPLSLMAQTAGLGRFLQPDYISPAAKDVGGMAQGIASIAALLA
jgi:hypothetical protein